MTEQTSLNRPKKRYSTLLSVLINIEFKIVILSFLAWFLLLIWYAVIALKEGMDVAAQASHKLLKSHEAWIAGRPFALCYEILSQISLLENQIQDNMRRVLTYVTSLLQTLHQSNLPNTHTVTATINIIVETAIVVFDRLFIFILSLPLWAGVLFIMIVDGLVQRDIRKFQAARESTFLFHRLKLLTGSVFGSFFFIYMGMPWAVQPQTLLLPMVVIVGALVMLTIKNYKKYV